ncbi:putative RING finger membrane protein, partial [Lachnellula suecica]
LLFPNEEWGEAWGNTTTEAQLQAVISQVSPKISFYQDLQDNLQTLSIQNADRSGTDSGFLYVPDIVETDACYNISKEYIPANVTRQASLPPTDFTLIAIAPWISAECTRAWMHAAREDPNRAFIFYLPNNETTAPPPPTSPVWDLGDGGDWKTKNQYPVYVVPGYYGERLVYELSLYSGNLTSVPYGHEISELPGIDPRYYVRLYTDISNANATTLPQFWVFLLLVIVVLVMILGCTSAAMHLIQRRRRYSLRRRVASGEVNLEAMGIKRLTVPQDCIDLIPLFIYNSESEKSLPFSQLHKRGISATTMERHVLRHDSASSNQTSQPISGDFGETVLVDDSISTPDSVLVHKFLPYSQPTCPICLDDYESGVTEIRELSCGHIFHPECIDTFLGSSSSLCPLCKKSALPLGYCPERITYAMVRRERNLRKLRSRITEDGGHADDSSPVWIQIKRLTLQLRNNIFATQPNRESSSAPQTPLFEQRPVLMTSALPCQPQPSVLGHQVARGPTRREAVEQRIRDIAASQSPIQDPDIAYGRQRHPQWRRTLSKAFPGFT